MVVYNNPLITQVSVFANDEMELSLTRDELQCWRRGCNVIDIQHTSCPNVLFKRSTAEISLDTEVLLHLLRMNGLSTEAMLPLISPDILKLDEIITSEHQPGNPQDNITGTLRDFQLFSSIYSRFKRRIRLHNQIRKQRKKQSEQQEQQNDYNFYEELNIEDDTEVKSPVSGLVYHYPLDQSAGLGLSTPTSGRTVIHNEIINFSTVEDSPKANSTTNILRLTQFA